MTETRPAVKYGTATVGVSAGNAIAYFGLEWARHTATYTPDDPVVAMAMGGALVSMILLEAKIVVRHIGATIKYVFDRVFPDTKQEPPKPE